MPNGSIKNYWLHEANRLLELALIGSTHPSRKFVERAIECLDKHEKYINGQDSNTQS